jgi:heme/copper-type cytochrome/quinol oxidase subunit 2
MKKVLKNLVVFSFIFVMSAAIALPAMASGDIIGINYASNFGLNATDGDVRQQAVEIIRYLMTFLGIIATVIILLGGFRWLTAAGNEDRIAEAKKTIIAGVIGLIIILAAFAIVTFVVNITNNSLS